MQQILCTLAVPLRQHLSVNSPNQGLDCLALDRVRAPVLSIPGYCIVLQPIRVSCQRLSLDPKVILPSIVLTRDFEGKLILQTPHVMGVPPTMCGEGSVSSMFAIVWSIRLSHS